MGDSLLEAGSSNMDPSPLVFLLILPAEGTRTSDGIIELG